MSAIIGLDPSVSGFGVCRLEGDGAELNTIKVEPLGDNWEQRLERYQKLASKVAHAVKKTDQPIFIESYSFGSKNSRAHSTGEFGCYLRLKMTQTFNVRVIEVTPKEVKKWVTGNGNANKGSVISKMSLESKLIFKDDNQADAYALASIGQHVLGLKVASNAERRKIVAAIRERHGLVFAE